MIKQTIKYSLISISIWALSACSNGRIITVGPETTTAERTPTVVAPTKRPDIKEEILLGTNAQDSNVTLGNRIDVPLNNPTLGEELAKDQMIERIPFPVEEYKYVRKRGSSTVSGTIYLENSHSSLKVKGQKIKLWLNPVTSYSRQWYEDSYLGGYKLSKTDKRLYNYLKFTYSDSSGKFNFFGVPAGDYYLTGTISCAKECGYTEEKTLRLVREISAGRGTTTVDLMKHVP